MRILIHAFAGHRLLHDVGVQSPLGKYAQQEYIFETLQNPKRNSPLPHGIVFKNCQNHQNPLKQLLLKLISPSVQPISDRLTAIQWIFFSFFWGYYSVFF